MKTVILSKERCEDESFRADKRCRYNRCGWSRLADIYPAGDVAAVKAGNDAGEAIAKEKGLLVNSEVIPSPSELLVPSLL